MMPVLITLLSVVSCRAHLGIECPYVYKIHFGISEVIFSLSVPDLRNICIERCENAMLECILDCNNDSACLSQCARIETDCIDRK